MRIRFAEYREAILPEYRGNPLIEALPQKPRDDELLDKLGFFPPHDESERGLDAFAHTDQMLEENFEDVRIKYSSGFSVPLIIKSSMNKPEYGWSELSVVWSSSVSI